MAVFRPGSAAAAIALAAVLVALVGPRAARAAPDPKRAVAVLEYRSGSAEIRDAAERVAKILAKRTSLEVLDPDQSRQRYGSNLDGRIAECAGAADCIAKIGRKLQAREILLIGVSQFGDVILTLQRIDSGKGEVVSRIAEALAPDTQPSEKQLLRYLERVMPRGDFLRFGTIRIEANLAGATVIIGTEKRGQTPIKPVRVRAPASYDIRLTKDGYVPFKASVEVPPDAEVKVNPVLQLRGAGGKAWYQRWWVWAIAGSVVVGTATAVALASGDGNQVSVVIGGL